MMKDWKKIAALLLVLAVLVAAFIFLNNNKGKVNVPSASATPAATDSVDEVKLVDIARDKLTKIILKRDGQDIALTETEKEIERLNTNQDGTTQKIKEKAKVWITSDFDADSSKIESIAYLSDGLKTKRLIAENASDLAAFGLDNPIVTTFVSSEGKEVNIELGNKTPTEDGYYARKTGSSTVYTIDSYNGDMLKSSKFDIISKNFYGSEALTIEDMNSLVYYREGSKLFESQKKDNANDWTLTYPLTRKADSQEFSKFVQWLVNMRASAIVAENSVDIKLYGLENPKYVFHYNLAGKPYSLKIGALKDSKYYAQIEGNPYVFELESKDLSFIDLPLIDLIDTFAYLGLIYDVEKLVIEMDNRVDELLIDITQEDSSKESYQINGKKIEGDDNISLFKRYYQGAIGISGDKLDLEAKPSGTAAIRLTYTLKKAGPDGKAVTVELIPTSDGYGYYILKNSQYTGLMIGDRQLDKDDDIAIRKAYKNLMEALNKVQ